MTLSQVQALKAFTQSGTDANVIGACFSKQFCEELSSENQDLWDNEQKLKNLQKLYDASKSQNMPKSMQM